MAKDSPWFKFISSEHTDGAISLCSDAAVGLFTRLCALYWSREGDLSVEFAREKFPRSSGDSWGELKARKCIKIEIREGVEMLQISFLDEQLIGRIETSKKAKEAIEARWSKTKKGPNGAKNTVVSEPYYDQNTGVNGSYYDPDTNKKEKEKETSKDVNPTVGKDLRKSTSVPVKPKTLPPLRAVGFLDGKPVAEVWKNYGRLCEDVTEGGKYGLERILEAFRFCWPSEISNRDWPTIRDKLTKNGREISASIVYDLAGLLNTCQIERLKDAKKFVDGQIKFYRDNEKELNGQGDD